MAHILIVDDDAAFRGTLAETVESLGHEVSQAANAEDGLRRLASGHFDAVFLDHRMPGMSGIEALTALKQRVANPPPVVLLTAYSSGHNVIEAMKLGAFDHLEKPVGRDDLAALIKRLLRRERAMPAATAEASDPTELVGISTAMREVHKRIGRAAVSDAPVLILGETGTGKEMVARALHRHSTRGLRPFVAVNCAAIPRELLESELFGHVRGAFTGAAGDRPGCFRSADTGVLLLDEIGDMAPSVQAKILRVLQEGEVTPVGSNRSLKVDVRLIAATHRDLQAAVAEGSFREDLLYRLNVLPIWIPPLRERLADIIPLAEHFLRIAAGSQASKRLSAEAAQMLLRHAWPGNVRELKNLMDRSQALLPHAVIGASDFESIWKDSDRSSSGDLPAGWLELDLPTATAKLERALIEHVLAASEGNRAEAARRLGIHRQLLYRKLAQYGLE